MKHTCSRYASESSFVLETLYSLLWFRMISQRKKLFWPAAILLILAAYICFNNFVFHQAAKEKPIEEVVKTITVDDLIAMVFWEKDNAQHIRKEILEERRNGQRDQERLAYSLQETIFFFNL